MYYNRRLFLAPLLVAPLKRALGFNFQHPRQLSVDNEAFLEDLKWRELADVWNPFVYKLNEGVFDVKLWNKVKPKLKALRVCEKD